MKRFKDIDGFRGFYSLLDELKEGIFLKMALWLFGILPRGTHIIHQLYPLDASPPGKGVGS